MPPFAFLKLLWEASGLNHLRCKMHGWLQLLRPRRFWGYWGCTMSGFAFSWSNGGRDCARVLDATLARANPLY